MSLERTIAEEVARQVAPLVKDLVLDLAGDALLRPAEAAALLSVSRSTLAELDLPKVYVTPSASRYRLSTIRKHMK